MTTSFQLPDNTAHVTVNGFMSQANPMFQVTRHMVIATERSL